MKLEECATVVCNTVVTGSGGRAQRLAVESSGTLALYEGSVRLRSWPLHIARLRSDLPNCEISIEMGGETVKWACPDETSRAHLNRAAVAATSSTSNNSLSETELASLLEDAEIEEGDAERRVKRLAEKLARLDALNVGGMLAAATEGGGARLAARLEEGSALGASLSARAGRLEALARAGGGALPARWAGGRADDGARALRAELAHVAAWLDAPALADLDRLPEIPLATAEGRARASAAADALIDALEAERTAPAARLRLAAVRERLRRLRRAREQLAAAVARHLNNALIHLANEAQTASGGPPRRHHAELAPYAPLARRLREMDERAHEALLRVYVSTWSKLYERETAAACAVARERLDRPDRVDAPLADVLTAVETLCDAEQDFCTRFFALDVDRKDGGECEKSEAAVRRTMCELFPALEQQLLGLLAHVERDPFGAMRALAWLGRRVLGDGGEAADGRWSRQVLAAVAVAAKRAADRALAERLAAMPDAVKQAAKKPKCGIFGFISELEEVSGECERIFAGGRRAELDRWYCALVSGAMAAVEAAEHPRTPRDVVQLENFHRLHAALSALRVPALEPLRREAKRRYADALRRYVTLSFGRPLDKVAAFFEGVAEAVAAGAREDEVCFRAAFGKHELRRLLALYPPHEVRRSLHRLYRSVEKHLSEEAGLLQVVWRAMQEEFLAQHVALQTRIAACYPGAGLALPLDTADILSAFSDIARDH
ncbi:unnamed protein product [Pieris macdunnoughi]|uniref:Exocyst complex component Sec3 C-terminal domain-containing protein n=1 Tax=Pieris macdunnoughi TaxID=345717 RepID=A0A821S538_9NEOP|nr:unnamed protein product [Pieris macdunnoughi]